MNQRKKEVGYEMGSWVGRAKNKDGQNLRNTGFGGMHVFVGN